MLKLFETAIKLELSTVDNATIFQMVGMSESVSTPNPNDIATIIRETTGLMKSNDLNKKKRGLSWLSEIVKNSSNNIFDYYYLPWMKIAVDTLMNSPGIYRDECFKIIAEIIRRSSVSKTDHSDSQLEQFRAVLQEILKTSTSDKFVGHLHCLKLLLQKHPSICKTQIDNIEKYIMSLQSSFNYEGVEVAASCMKYLPAVFGDQSAVVWGRIFNKLINTLMRIMKMFYSVFHLDMHVVINDEDSYDILDLQKHSMPFLGFSRSIHMLCACVTEMLTVDYIHVISVQPIQVISFFGVVFNCTLKVDHNDRLAEKKRQWLTILPTILKITFHLMENLILNCPQFFCGCSVDIFSLLIKQLKSLASGHNYSILKSRVYNVLSVLINAMSEMYIENYMTTILSFLIKDIQPVGKVNPLAELEQREICVSALKVLRALIKRKHLDTQKFSGEILKIFDAMFFASSSYPVPYNDFLCRYELYHILMCCMNKLAACEIHNFSVALQIFKRGKEDTNMQISNFCDMAHEVSISLSVLKSQTTQMVGKNELYFNHDTPQDCSDQIIQPPEIVTAHMKFSGDNTDDLISLQTNHNEEIEDEESVDDEQMENEESGEECEEDEGEEYEDEEEYEQEQAPILDMDSSSECKPKEKVPVDNGYFIMQNGTVSSDEAVTPTSEKRKIGERIQDSYVSSPQSKKIKKMDDCSQDGSLSDDSTNLNAMMSDFIDKPPDEDDTS